MTTPRIDEEPIDLDLSWGDEPPASDPLFVPIDMPADQWFLRGWMWLLIVAAILLAIFVVGMLVGGYEANKLADAAIAKVETVDRIAAQREHEAAAWEQQAVEASAALHALQGHANGLQIQLDDMQAVLDEATQTIKALTAERDRLKELKATKPVPVPEAMPVASRAGTGEVRALIAASFPAHAVAEAVYIAQHESGLNPNAANGDCLGVFQLAGVHGTRAQRLDAEWNVRTAARLWAQSGNSFDRHWYSHTSYARYGG